MDVEQDYLRTLPLSQASRKSVQIARCSAAKLHCKEVAVEHLLVGALSLNDHTLAWRLLHSDGIGLGSNAYKFADHVLTLIVDMYPMVTDDVKAEETRLTPGAKAALEIAHTMALTRDDNFIGSDTLLLAIIEQSSKVVFDALRQFGKVRQMSDVVEAAAARNFRLDSSDEGQPSYEGRNPYSPASSMSAGAPQPGSSPSTRSSGSCTQGSTPIPYTKDLTQLASEGRFDPVIGREAEIRRAVEVLLCKTKNCAALVGEPGVGKTAIVEGMAQALASGSDIVAKLAGSRLLSLDLGSMLAGAVYRGEFEARIEDVIKKIVARKGAVILFVDELHTLIGAGAAQGGLDASNILKPYLSRGDLRIIGATTLDEYRKHIEKDAALERRFTPIHVSEPGEAETREILKGLRPRYQQHHDVTISDEALAACVELSSRFIPSRFQPDKSIDLMDQSCSYVRVEPARPAGEPVGESDVAEVVARATGIPTGRLVTDERERLLHLEEQLHGRVIGQDEAVRFVSKAIRRNRAGFGDPRRPVGCFMFVGPTGVGKTELARALAESIFSDEKALLRLDMSEYAEPHTVSRLFGSPPGYVGYGEGGQLTEPVRHRPYQVVLLDEIEKAHPQVHSALLHVMEEGVMTDGEGRKVDFRNTIVIMTSNVGTGTVAAERGPLGFVPDVETKEARSRQSVADEVRSHFRAEFVNRFDAVVVFEHLTREHLASIVDLAIADVRRRRGALDITIDVTDAAREYLLKVGFSPRYGARELRRVIQDKVVDPLAELTLAERFVRGDHILIDATGEGLCFLPGSKVDSPETLAAGAV